MEKLAAGIHYLIISLAITILVVGCGQNSSNLYINSEELDLSSWEIKKHINAKDYELFTYSKQEGDTTTILDVWKFQTGSEETTKYIYKKTYEDKNYKYFITGASDTLSFYRESKSKPGHLYFFRGKYHYDYKHFKLTPGQAEFFENHFDSLTRIEGNDLPELPEVSFLSKN